MDFTGRHDYKVAGLELVYGRRGAVAEQTWR